MLVHLPLLLLVLDSIVVGRLVGAILRLLHSHGSNLGRRIYELIFNILIRLCVVNERLTAVVVLYGGAAARSACTAYSAATTASDDTSS